MLARSCIGDELQGQAMKAGKPHREEERLLTPTAVVGRVAQHANLRTVEHDRQVNRARLVVLRPHRELVAAGRVKRQIHADDRAGRGSHDGPHPARLFDGRARRHHLGGLGHDKGGLVAHGDDGRGEV